MKDSSPLPGPDIGPGLGIREGTPAAVGVLRQGSGSRAGIGTADKLSLQKQGAQTCTGAGWLQTGRSGAAHIAAAQQSSWGTRAAICRDPLSAQLSSWAPEQLYVVLTRVTAMQHAQL